MSGLLRRSVAVPLERPAEIAVFLKLGGVQIRRPVPFHRVMPRAQITDRLRAKPDTPHPPSNLPKSTETALAAMECDEHVNMRSRARLKFRRSSAES
jgi:hypothetical protein